MADTYLLLWSQERVKQMKAQAQDGEVLTVLFGGPHQSEPGFRRFGVKEGDYLCPVMVSGGVLYLLGRMRVQRLLSIEEYVAQNPETFADYASSWGASWTLKLWQDEHPQYRYLAPTCTSEAALGVEGTPLGTMVAVPPDVLEAVRFRFKKGERGIRNVVDGRLKSHADLDGRASRLSEASALQFQAVLAGAMGLETQPGPSSLSRPASELITKR